MRISEAKLVFRNSVTTGDSILSLKERVYGTVIFPYCYMVENVALLSSKYPSPGFI